MLGRRSNRLFRVDGAIAHLASRGLAAALANSGVPVVNVASMVRGLTFPRVCLDHRAVGRMAAVHLLERGFRQFAFVGYAGQVFSEEREEGFREALGVSAKGMKRYLAPAARVHDPADHLQRFDADVRPFLASLPKSTGLFAVTDIWGLRVCENARAMGIRVPGELAVLGVDNDELLREISRPSLSSVVTSAERVGFEAAETLDRMLRGAEVPGLREIAPRTVAARASTDVLAGIDGEVASAIQLIRSSTGPMSVKELLRQVALSRRALERRFRSAIGRTPFEEIRRVRLERAAELLSGTDLPVKRVARQAGFTETKRLCAAFRTVHGMTPLQYRQANRTGAAPGG